MSSKNLKDSYSTNTFDTPDGAYTHMKNLINGMKKPFLHVCSNSKPWQRS